MTKRNPNSSFAAGSGVYICRCCQKHTRETGAGESMIDLCLNCYEGAGLENEHTDGHHDAEPEANCPDCKAEADLDA